MTIDHKVIEWIKRIGTETGAFEILKVESERATTSSFGKVIWDYVVELALKPFGFPIRLYVEARNQITPRLALGMLPRLKVASTGGIALLCTSSVSMRLAEMCKDADVGYLDSAGNCRLSAPGLFVFINGRTATDRTTKKLLNPFSTKSSRIVRVMLEKPSHSWQVQELAAEAKVNMGLAFKVKDSLLNNALLVEVGGRVRIRNAKALLNEWSNAYEAHGEEVSLYVMGKAREIEDKVGILCKQRGYRYGLTEFSGAWREAPTVRYERSTVYLADGDEPLILGEIRDSLKAKKVESGSNLKLRG